MLKLSERYLNLFVASSVKKCSKNNFRNSSLIILTVWILFQLIDERVNYTRLHRVSIVMDSFRLVLDNFVTHSCVRVKASRIVYNILGEVVFYSFYSLRDRLEIG